MKLRTPELTPKKMAEFNMRPTHDRWYREANLAKSEEVYGKAYADDVRRYMNAIQTKRGKSRKAGV